MVGKPEVRDGFRFRGGRPELDLLATVTGRLRGEPTDALASPPDLGRWLAAAGLTEVAPAPAEAELVHARALREVLYRLALARAEGRPLADDDRRHLNECAAEPAAPPQLGDDGKSRRSGDVRGLLAGLARAGVELLGCELSSRIRQCEGPSCAILYLDTSRRGDRRWCSMAGCGNRAKVAEFRQRERLGRIATE